MRPLCYKSLNRYEQHPDLISLHLVYENIADGGAASALLRVLITGDTREANNHREHILFGIHVHITVLVSPQYLTEANKPGYGQLFSTLLKERQQQHSIKAKR
jgi:hypothetical protein